MAYAASEWVGMAAAFLTTGSFVPQALRVLKTRDTRAISLAMYAMFTTGSLLWFIYGICIKSTSVFAANAITFFLALTILILKLNNDIRNAGPH
jgi:MtN3 and saliva related transmembrane protein